MVCDDKAGVPQVAGRLAPPCGMRTRCTEGTSKIRGTVECGSRDAQAR
jgi:hypothetical protein